MSYTRWAAYQAGDHNRATNPFVTIETPRSYEWEDLANCAGKPTELFEYQEKDSPLTKKMTWKQRAIFNQGNFEKAAEICIECPVFFECGANATEEDRFWTVRMGEAPGRFATEAEQASKIGRPKRDGPRHCHRGHFIPDGGRCTECRKINKRKHREAAKAAADGVS